MALLSCFPDLSAVSFEVAVADQDADRGPESLLYPVAGALEAQVAGLIHDGVVFVDPGPPIPPLLRLHRGLLP